MKQTEFQVWVCYKYLVFKHVWFALQPTEDDKSTRKKQKQLDIFFLKLKKL